MRGIRFGLMAVLLMLFPVARGQEPVGPILVHETGATNCDNYRAVVDLWMGEVNRDAVSIGYAVVQGPDLDLLPRLLYRDWIYGQLEHRHGKNWNRRKFIVVEGASSPQLTVQFWQTRTAIPEKLMKEKKWDLSLALTKPIKFDIGDDPGGLCAPFDSKRVFTELLKANPNVSGNVVLFERTSRGFWANQHKFIASYGSDIKDRLRFFRSKRNDWKDYELWIVPKKK